MVNDTTIHTMPEEVLSIILQMLPPPSKYVAMSVCKRWEKLLRQRRLWRRDRKAWEEMMVKLHTWLKMPPPNEDMLTWARLENYFRRLYTSGRQQVLS